MGYIKHHTIVITSWDDEKLLEAYQKAKKCFIESFGNNVMDRHQAEKLVSPIVPGLSNGQASFFIAPDGSKEGWETSDDGNRAREAFLDFLAQESHCDYVEIMFGGDDGLEAITRSRDIDTYGDSDEVN